MCQRQSSSIEHYVNDILNEVSPGLFQRDDDQSARLVARIIASRKKFGITRLGSITRLDRIGLPVAQTVRPLSLSNTVSQGKGLTLVQAAASSLMESIETWAGEQIPAKSITTAKAVELGIETIAMFGPVVEKTSRSHWHMLNLQWTQGWDFLSRAIKLVPVALVDTIYTVPPIHPDVFVRTTTGLGAGETRAEALLQACLEIIERNSVGVARQTPGFFDDWQIDNGSLSNLAADLVERFMERGFTTAIWQVPGPAAISTFWCHLVPFNRIDEIAPYPSEGFASDLSSDRAIVKALLEAAQARVSVISGAREDINRSSYPVSYDLDKLDRWRRHVASPLRSRAFASSSFDSSYSDRSIEPVMEALREAGANAVIGVPLYADDIDGLHVVRVVSPPLRHF
jgi:ribosomal protein S12 methylthiotransferase accessory factor